MTFAIRIIIYTLYYKLINKYTLTYYINIAILGYPGYPTSLRVWDKPRPAHITTGQHLFQLVPALGGFLVRSSLAETTAPAFPTHSNAVMFHSRLSFSWPHSSYGYWMLEVHFSGFSERSWRFVMSQAIFPGRQFLLLPGPLLWMVRMPLLRRFVASKTGCRAFFTIQFSPFALGNFAKTHSSHLSSNRQVLDIWVCLKMGYTPQMLICIRKMMISHQVNQVWGYFIFRQTYFGISSQVAISRFSHGPEVHLHLFGLSKVSSICIE